MCADASWTHVNVMIITKNRRFMGTSGAHITTTSQRHHHVFPGARLMFPLSKNQKPLILVSVLFGNVVLRHFARSDFALVGIECIFHAADCCCFPRLTFLQQFFHTLSIHNRSSRHSLHITRLSSRS